MGMPRHGTFALTLAAPARRSVAYLLLGVLLSTVIVGPGPAEGATTYTRSVSCASFNFHPIDSITQQAWNPTERYLYRAGSAAGDGFFLCDPGLPHKAVVTRVRFTLMDASDLVEARYCALYRMSLAPTYPSPTPNVMAQVDTTGHSEEPGKVRLQDTTINFATVDNSQYSYWLQCQLYGDPRDYADVGLYGAEVTFRITAANG
jgi:hypothetical protein